MGKGWWASLPWDHPVWDYPWLFCFMGRDRSRWFPAGHGQRGAAGCWVGAEMLFSCDSHPCHGRNGLGSATVQGAGWAKDGDGPTALPGGGCGGFGGSLVAAGIEGVWEALLLFCCSCLGSAKHGEPQGGPWGPRVVCAVVFSGLSWCSVAVRCPASASAFCQLGLQTSLQRLAWFLAAAAGPEMLLFIFTTLILALEESRES